MKYPHPTIEHVRKDFVVVIEAAKNKRSFGKVALRPRKYFVGNGTLCIVNLITVRQVDNFFPCNVPGMTPEQACDPQSGIQCSQRQLLQEIPGN